MNTRSWNARAVVGVAVIALSVAVALTLTAVRSAHADGAYSEQQGHHGVDTFTNYHNASGVGPRIDPFTWVVVSCKVYDPYIGTANPDGYWYRIASSPWNDNYYSPANTFYNGDPIGGPYTHNTDFNVPDCGSSPPPPPPSPSVQLAQGPTAPAGYRYAVSLSNFAPNSSVSVNCRDSVDPSGFYTFDLSTDGSGNGYTETQCYSNDGPDHWVVANDVESNHVSWSGDTPVVPVSTPTSGPTTSPPTTPTPPSTAASHYVALGDSYSAGEGAPPFISGPAGDPIDKCHRSRYSYSEVLAGTPGFPSRDNTEYWACSGAEIGNFYHGQNGEPPQLGHLNEATSLVTLTAGGNDVKFSKILISCTLVAHCQLGEQPIINALINHTVPRLSDLYSSILSAAPGAQVYVLGYPQFISSHPSLSCQAEGIGTDEAQWMASKVADFDQKMETQIKALRDPRLHFVSDLRIFANGEACSVAGSLVNSYVPRHPEYSFHPTRAGQILMASKLAHAVRG